jgi:Skp family chaperone for outer membrane proteins
MIRSFIITDLFLAICLPFLSFGQRAGMVDVDSLIKLMPETQIAVKKLDSAFTYYETKLDVLSDSMTTLSKSPPKGPKVTEQQKKDYIKNVNALSERIRLFQKTAETELESYRLQLHEPIEKKVKEICIELGKKKGYNVLVETQKKEKGILYTEKEPEDITWMVIAEIVK